MLFWNMLPSFLSILKYLNNNCIIYYLKKNSGSFKFRDFVETYFGKIRPTLSEIDIESFIKVYKIYIIVKRLFENIQYMTIKIVVW